jgi:hypothetical protein
MPESIIDFIEAQILQKNACQRFQEAYERGFQRGFQQGLIKGVLIVLRHRLAKGDLTLPMAFQEVEDLAARDAITPAAAKATDLAIIRLPKPNRPLS